MGPAKKVLDKAKKVIASAIIGIGVSQIKVSAREYVHIQPSTRHSQLEHEYVNENRQETRNRLDAILILGSGRIPYGSEITARAAAEYSKINGNGAIPIVVSGGRGRFCKNMKETEAEKIKRELIAQGINEGVIKTEPESGNTYQNFQYSKDLIYLLSAKRKNVRIGVVDFSSHMSRALRYGKKAMVEGNVLFEDYELVPIYIKHNCVKSIFSEIVYLAFEGVRPFLNSFSRI